jgi:transcriptional regulator with XRE-family HTH domain
MLKELRREKGVSQEELAESLGVPQSYVSKYELGERRLDLVETFEICRALNTDFVAFVRAFAKRVESERGSGIENPRRNRYGQR